MKVELRATPDFAGRGNRSQPETRRPDIRHQAMKRSSTIFLQIVVVLFGIAVLAFLLWEPHVEGRNKHATVFEIYFKDWFLAYVYIASIPFFMALVQAFKVLGYAG